MPPVTLPKPSGRDNPARARARAALLAQLFDRDGIRRLPTSRALKRALEACHPNDVFWVCEMNSAGPLYFLPTREWISTLVKLLEKLRARRVLEVAAGDGFLSRCLAAANPRLEVIATDDASWSKPAARMNASERRRFAHTPVPGLAVGDNVQRLEAVRAVRRFKPDLVLVCWAPPGVLVERVIKAPTKHVIDISVDGDVCGDGVRTWRFAKEFLEGPIERRALCRLDVHPRETRHTRVTLYYGKRHPEFFEERDPIF